LLIKDIAVQKMFAFEDLVLRMFLSRSGGNGSLTWKWDSIDFVNEQSLITMTDQLLSQEEIDALLSPMDKKDIDPQQENASDEKSTKHQSINYSRENDSDASLPKNEMNVILGIPLEITVELGRMQMVINDLLKLGQGSVIDLPKNTGETLNILANRKLIAKGQLIEVDEKYSLRLTEVISPIKQVNKLNTSS